MEKYINKPKISVVVCTYNRAELLDKCLQALVRQAMDETDYEVIVVNNSSTDNTEEIVKQFSNRYRNVSLVDEQQQGLSYARNKGWWESRGEYIAYVDDDARCREGWLLNAMKVIKEVKPEIFGGPIYPMYLEGKPKWFKDEYEIRIVSKEARMLNKNEYISGSNMFFKRELLETLGGFNTALGMKGNSLGYGEETELMIRARRRFPGCAIYYQPDVCVSHLVPREKMRISYFVKTRYARGHSMAKYDCKSNMRKQVAFTQLMLSVMVIIKKMTLGLVFQKREKHRYWQNYFIEEVAYIFYDIGGYFAVLLR